MSRRESKMLQAVVDTIDRHEASITAAYLKRWWCEAPETFAVARDRKGSDAGFYCIFDPNSVPGWLCREDPVARAWLNHLNGQPLPRQLRAFILRRWLSAEMAKRRPPFRRPAGWTSSANIWSFVRTCGAYT